MKNYVLVLFLLFGLIFMNIVDVGECADVGIEDEDEYDDEEEEDCEEYEDDEYRNYESEEVKTPYLGWVKKPGNITCSAALIETDIAVTSADCIVDNDEDMVTVHFGVNSLENPGSITAKVIEFIIHPDYDHDTINSLENNIGLIRFEKPLTLSKRVKIIPIHSFDWPENEIKVCESSGFDVGFNTSLRLNVTAARGDQYCLCLNADRFICANETIVGKQCITDTGGPLVCDEQLVGVRYGSYKKSNCSPSKRRKCKKKKPTPRTETKQDQQTTVQDSEHVGQKESTEEGSKTNADNTEEEESTQLSTEESTQLSTEESTQLSTEESTQLSTEGENQQTTEEGSKGTSDDTTAAEDLGLDVLDLDDKDLENAGRIGDFSNATDLVKTVNSAKKVRDPRTTGDSRTEKIVITANNAAAVRDLRTTGDGTTEEIETEEIGLCEDPESLTVFIYLYKYMNWISDELDAADHPRIEPSQKSAYQDDDSYEKHASDDHNSESENKHGKGEEGEDTDPDYFGEDYDITYDEISEANSQTAAIKFLLMFFLVQIRIHFI